MRADVARILIGMGYNSETDFEAHLRDDGTARLVWLSKSPQPDERAIDDAAPAALQALQAEETKRIESTTARDDAKRALSALDTIIAGAPTATTAQLRAAVEQLARIQRHLILATVGR